MMLVIGFAFLSVAMFAALYFGYQRIERRRYDMAAEEWRLARASRRPASSVRGAHANASRKAEPPQDA